MADQSEFVSLRQYWLARAREAWMTARVKVEALLFLLFLVSGPILFRPSPAIQIEKTTWALGFLLFLVVFLFELCFVSPYNHAKTLIQERDNLKLGLDELRETIRQSAKSKTETLLSKAVDMMRESRKAHIADFFVEPIGALISVADELQTEEEVAELCDALRKHTGLDPFVGLSLAYQTTFEGRRLSFIKEARYNTETTQVRNDDDAIKFAYTYWSQSSTLPDIYSSTPPPLTSDTEEPPTSPA